MLLKRNKMQLNTPFFNKVVLFFKGVAMGAANKVPGVSGGTVAFVFKFYEELIYSFKKVNASAFKLLINGHFKSFYNYINGPFLFLIMSGSIFSYFTVSLVLDYFLLHYELYVWSAFFGMIIGSVYSIGKDFREWNAKTIVSIIIGIAIGVGISFLKPATENDNLWFVFICGVIGVSGMTLPGLSGSFILILLGNYVLLLVDSVNELSTIIRNVIMGNFEVFLDPIKMRYLKIISVFTLGSVFGLVTFSHILGYVLKKWHQIVNAVIIGFIIGSLGIVWPWKKTIYLKEQGQFLIDKKGHKIVENYDRFMPNMNHTETWIAVFYIILGIVLILGIDFYGRKKE